MPSRMIHVAASLKETIPREAYLDQDPEKGVITTELPAGPLSRNSIPRYRDKVTWIAVVYRGIPDTVSVAGLKYLFNGRENRIRRLIWGIILIVAMAVMGYQVFERCLYYSRYPKSVDVEINYVQELTFPTVAFCNYNSFRKSVMQKAPELSSFYLDVFNSQVRDFNVTKYEDLLGHVNTTEHYIEAAHMIDNSFVYGYWGTQLLTPDNFSYDLFDFGVCFTFNTGEDGKELLKVDTSGKTYGFGLILDTQQWDYFYSSDFLRVSCGFQVMIYDRNEVPLVTELGFAVGPGTENLVGIEITEVNNLPPPHGVCGSKTLKYYSSYTSNGCREECQTDFIVDHCGCRAPHMPGEARVCNPVELYDCVKRATEKFVDTGSEKCGCPIPCHSVTYEPTISQAKFPSNFWSETLTQIYMDAYNISRTSDYFSENMVYINLFFKELSIEKITQQVAYPFFSLLCDIGGSMGLWLGGSILTIFELFDLFGHSTYFYYARLSQRR